VVDPIEFVIEAGRITDIGGDGYQAELVRTYMADFDDPDAYGRAYVGQRAGQIWLNNDSGCRMEATFAHELGHAFGFFHLDRPAR